MADLYLLAEDGAVAQRWEIGDQPAAVGRDEIAEITIPDATLSRRHFMIWREGDNYLIKDLNSQNGTFVDGQRVRGTTLRHDVCIAAGRTLFLFRERSLTVNPAGVLPAAVTPKGPLSGARIMADPDAPAGH